MQKYYETIIIGTGFGGLGMAHDLKKADRDDFLILEKASDLGGTWRENSYLGAECDVNSALYSYSYAMNPSWDYKWSKQPQILEYMQNFARDHDLIRHMQFGTKVEAASFNDTDETWTIKTDRGDFTCRFLVSAVGQLHHPQTPAISGSEEFKGAAFHAAQWDHDVQLNAKRVAVVGSAASAVQLIPHVAKVAKRLTVFQRSPNWILNKGNRRITRIEKWFARTFPLLMKIKRGYSAAQGEYVLFPAIKGARLQSKLLKHQAEAAIKKHIKDPEMQKALTPNYSIGAKRILFIDDYYPALAQDNVDLVTSGIEKMTSNGLVASDGTEVECDVVIFATGFRTNPFLLGIDVTGRDGKKLSEHWGDGAYAYNGVTTSGFPNLFFLYGPNTNTGSGSIIYFLERQVRYIVQLIENSGDRKIEVKAEAEKAYVDEIQQSLSELAWAKIEDSWYKDGEKITNNWPYNMKQFGERLAKPEPEHFV